MARRKTGPAKRDGDKGGDCATQWMPVNFPVMVLKRVDRVFARLGYPSRGEYIRAAVIEKLERDEWKV